MVLRVGSTGDGVTRIQKCLSDLHLFSGSIDGTFTPDLKTGLQQFQRTNGLDADGIAGDITQAALFPPAICGESLDKKCLALTGSFETNAAAPGCFSGLTGNFDGQGISFGALQWNLGQKTLQPLLTKMLSDHPNVAAAVFGSHLDELREMLSKPLAGQLAWANSIQNARHVIAQPWAGMFVDLGQTPEFQQIQIADAAVRRGKARDMCTRFGVNSERALALMFDICVQNGFIDATVETRIRHDFTLIPAGASPLDAEVARLRIIANRRAEVSKAAFVEDVRRRKLAIAEGTGTVHGVSYHLGFQFGIRLQPMTA